jgi:PST family polysaccharide transporter
MVEPPDDVVEPPRRRGAMPVLLSIGVIQVMLILVGMGRAKFLSVLLGPAGFGVVSTIDQVVLSMVHLAGLSLPFTAMKFMSRSHSESQARFKSSYASFLRAMLGLSFVALAIASLVLVWRPQTFGADLVPYREVLLVALVALPALLLNIYFVHALAAAQEASASAAVNLLVTLALAAAACIGVWVGGIRALYVATAAVGVVTTLATYLFVRHRAGVGFADSDAGILQELRRSPEVVSFSFMLYVALSAYSLAMLITRYVVFARLGEVEAGFLQALMGISLALGAVLGPMNTLYLTPLVNRTMPAEQKLRAAHDFQQKVALMLAVSVLPALLFPRLVLAVLYAPAFQTAATVLYFFIGWQVLYQLVNVYQQLLIGLDDVRFFAVTTAAGFALAAALSYVLVPALGLAGAALALTLGILWNGLAAAWRLRTRHGGAIPAGVWRLILFCLASIAGAGYVFSRLEEWSVEGLAIRIGYAAVFIAVTWGVLSADQRALVHGLVRRYGARVRSTPR